jgi:hypothetical protein
MNEDLFHGTAHAPTPAPPDDPRIARLKALTDELLAELEPFAAEQRATDEQRPGRSCQISLMLGNALARAHWMHRFWPRLVVALERDAQADPAAEAESARRDAETRAEIERDGWDAWLARRKGSGADATHN